MTNSYETVDFLKEQKVKLGGATYIVNAHFLNQGETQSNNIDNILQEDKITALYLRLSRDDDLEGENNDSADA